ncbi:hypothetical protein HZH68_003018 [Vespula germanica]|uniref:Uncharacterized protein n=1 Tax=Vespula germanica TaxID=30212 RepID=A0A834NNC6_VESGE|nr:hypothetical protein HZH68_003018 [Vespula germanica]
MLYTTIRVVERTVEWHTFRKLALQKNTICDKLTLRPFEKIISSLDDKEFRRSLRFPRTVTKNDDVKIHSILKEISALK